MRTLPILSSAFLLCVSALANAAVPTGVWEGTLAGKKIVACFNTASTTGSYYYTRHLAPIPLERGNEDDSWREPGDTGTWQITRAGENALSGNWRNTKSGKALPIALSLLDGASDPKACARSRYNVPLETTPEIKPDKRKRFEGRAYRTLHFLGQETLQILDDQPGTRAVNRQLASLLDPSDDAVAAYFAARRAALGETGRFEEDQLFTEPVYWTPQWLTIRFYRWAAGQGRNGISWGYRTWNMQTGQEVDPWSWFGGRSDYPTDPYNSGSARLPKRLRHFLFDYEKIDLKNADPNCKDNYSLQASYHLVLSTAGVQFSQPEYGSGCELAFTVPYEKLSPVLTPSGKLAVQRIMTSRQSSARHR